MRSTSIKAYEEIRDDGLLSLRRWQVYDYVFHHGPCSMMKANLGLNHGTYSNGSYTSRFSELRRMGLIKEVGTEVCKYTGKTVIIWDVTSSLPCPLKRPISRQRLEVMVRKCIEKIKEQQLEIDRLRARVR